MRSSRGDIEIYSGDPAGKKRKKTCPKPGTRENPSSPKLYNLNKTPIFTKSKSKNPIAPNLKKNPEANSCPRNS